jgi:hypothetical protein
MQKLILIWLDICLVSYTQSKHRVWGLQPLDYQDRIGRENMSRCYIYDAKISHIDHIYWPSTHLHDTLPTDYRANNIMKNPDGPLGILYISKSSIQ